MSITRLQQARQMYAMGQRVGFKGGGADMGKTGSSKGSSGPAGGASSGGNYGGNTNTGSSNNTKSGNGGNPNNDGPSNYHGGGADRIPTTPVTPTLPSNVRTVDTIMTSPNIGANISTNPLDFKEQYRIGNKPFTSSSMYINNPYAVGIADPYMTLGLETKRKDNYIDRMNLQGATYKPLNIPTLMGGAVNFLGGLGFEKNKNFFLENVAGKYGFGYDENSYKDYMRKRSLGEIQAYGRPFTEGELRNQVGGGDGGNTGIMTVNNTDDGDADGDGDVDQDDFIFRYFDKTGETLQAGAGGVQDLMKSIRERISNIFS